MNIVRRVIFSLFCLFAAIGCYVFGIPVGGAVFFILGLIFEGLFWFGIFGKKKNVTSQ